MWTVTMRRRGRSLCHTIQQNDNLNKSTVNWERIVKTRHAWRDTHTWTMNDQGKSSENVHVTWIFTVLNHKINSVLKSGPAKAGPAGLAMPPLFYSYCQHTSDFCDLILIVWVLSEVYQLSGFFRCYMYWLITCLEFDHKEIVYALPWSKSQVGYKLVISVGGEPISLRKCVQNTFLGKHIYITVTLVSQ